MNLKRIVRKLERAFDTKDSKVLDEAIEELEREEDRHHDEDPDTVEVHNHIPNMDGIGEMPGKDPPGFGGAKDNEAPPWFEEHKKSFDAFCKKMTDDIGNLQKWAKEEEKEPDHQEDRRHDDMAGEEVEGAESENLEMDRHRDRRQDDEPSERQEMAERIKENQKDRHRDRRHDDEANKEILGELEFEAPPGTGDSARKARDSAFLEDSFQDVTSKAELLAPGLSLPTFDAKASPVKTGGAIFRLRKTALDLAYNEPKTRGVIDQAMGGRALDTKRMSNGQARVLFNAVAANVASSNNRRATDGGSFEAGGGIRTNAGAKIQSIADINKFNRDKHARRA